MCVFFFHLRRDVGEVLLAASTVSSPLSNCFSNLNKAAASLILNKKYVKNMNRVQQISPAKFNTKGLNLNKEFLNVNNFISDQGLEEDTDQSDQSVLHVPASVESI